MALMFLVGSPLGAEYLHLSSLHETTRLKVLTTVIQSKRLSPEVVHICFPPKHKWTASSLSN